MTLLPTSRKFGCNWKGPEKELWPSFGYIFCIKKGRKEGALLQMVTFHDLFSLQAGGYWNYLTISIFNPVSSFSPPKTQLKLLGLIFSSSWICLLKTSKIFGDTAKKGTVQRGFQLQDFFMNQSSSWVLATRVIDTGGKHWLVNISTNFSYKFEMTLMVFSGTWGKTIHIKNWSKKCRDTVPLIEFNIA